MKDDPRLPRSEGYLFPPPTPGRIPVFNCCCVATPSPRLFTLETFRAVQLAAMRNLPSLERIHETQLARFAICDPLLVRKIGNMRALIYGIDVATQCQ